MEEKPKKLVPPLVTTRSAVVATTASVAQLVDMELDRKETPLNASVVTIASAADLALVKSKLIINFTNFEKF